MPRRKPHSGRNGDIMSAEEQQKLQRQLEQLRLEQGILHRLAHRNKNQHRRERWYRDMAGLRRGLARYLECVGGGGDKRSADELVSVWRDVHVGRWYRSFSQLVASSQFSPIGLVLLGCLARICRIVGITEALEKEKSGASTSVKDANGGDDDGDRIMRDVIAGFQSDDDDIGEIVERDT
ncbi:hypothetical protein BDY21DRAFT_345146 [Lineolata rhizophorae]|uniref:RNase MRP protein 1 RNA binding domain-containing protein n=1 Tax=Lineolata rhizophorae TaxID=578093 RepID=A0A6A6P055_9PEZI|nr:hypothetical protein BDY21DRAFT_345146 [Lineolata rhizophorae]